VLSAIEMNAAGRSLLADTAIEHDDAASDATAIADATRWARHDMHEHHREHENENEADREPMVQMATSHYAPYRWVQAPIAALAMWLIASPFALGQTRVPLVWSDIVSGAIVLVLSAFALGRRRGLVSWSIGLVGVWLMAAPLLFWAPDAATYTNDTLIGAMLFAFGFLIPMGMQMPGADVPPGWTYNPSSWPQRAPIITLAFVSFLVARHMAAYQLGHNATVDDPFFGEGTMKILDSDVSRAWPVSDAGLGAMTYLIETLMGFMGDQRRWRTMPWMVAAFGVIVVPLGIVSIVLVVMQPLAVGQWCTPCLFTAAAMLLMIPLSLDEIVAMVQFVRRRRHEGRSAWRVFWLGSELSEDEARAERQLRETTWRPRGMLWGFTNTWSLWASVAIGVWLMFAPAVFGVGIETSAADSDHLVGAIVIVFAVIALAEVARPVRFLNIPLAIWLLVAPWVTSGGTGALRISDIAAGVLLLVVSLPLGRLRDHYGTFDRLVVWSPRSKARARHQAGPWATQAAR
jgi:hypothetical protein